MNNNVDIGNEEVANTDNNALKWVAVVALIYCILLAVGMIGSGFKTATGGEAKELFAFAANPFMALIIGTICTALIQSSSTVTSIIVGLVAGGLPVSIAIPMVMGANIGTTITNTLVSLGHVRDKKEFRRAFAAATVHDFFNLLSVIIFLPLEISFHFLEKMSAYVANFFVGGDSMSIKGLNFIKPITKPIISSAKDLFGSLGLESNMTGAVMIVVGISLIFFAITFTGRILKVLMVGRAKQVLHSTIGRGPLRGMTSGAIVTVLVQSSSTTTSLMVPLVGSGVFKVRDIYPFTIGANVGTCITALLAATAISDGNAIFALQVAIVHLIYNILGAAVIYGIPLLREIPLTLSEKLARAAAEQKLYAVAYIVGVFFIIPGLLILTSN